MFIAADHTSVLELVNVAKLGGNEYLILVIAIERATEKKTSTVVAGRQSLLLPSILLRISHGHKPMDYIQLGPWCCVA